MPYTFEIVLYALLTLSLVATRQIRPRVVGGVPDEAHEFPFAVMIQFNHPPMFRTCSGSLIAPAWVLTAAHCTHPGYTSLARVKYGDPTLPSNETKFFSNIIKGTQHPGFKQFGQSRSYNDIGLYKIEQISNAPLATLSAIDYIAFMGLPVKYAGFGRTTLALKGEKMPTSVDVWYDLEPPFRVGEAVVISCKQNGGVFLGNPYICIAPRCGPHAHQQAYFGDSGGPLVYNGRIIGVTSGCDIDTFKHQIPIVAYTPVSPFLDWIYDTIHSD